MATRSTSTVKELNKIEASIASEEDIDQTLQQVLTTLGADAAVSYLQGQVLYYTLLAPRSNNPHRTAMKARWYADQLGGYFER